MYKIIITSTQTGNTYTYAKKYKLKKDAVKAVNQIIKVDKANGITNYIYTVTKE